MATSLLYLGPCLGPCFILVTAGSGGVCVYSCCSCCSCCGVAEAVIRVAGGTAIGVAGGAVIRVATGAVIGTTSGAAVGIASGIGRAAGGIGGGSYRACWRDGACADGACADGACADGACVDGACPELVAELKARAEIRQLKELEVEELKVFNSLRLSVVDAVEAAAEVLAELAGGTELKAWVEIWQPEELKVLLMAVYY